MHVGHFLFTLVGFYTSSLDLNIIACILIWIQLYSMKQTPEDVERPETALYCGVGLLAIMPSYAENYRH